MITANYTCAYNIYEYVEYIKFLKQNIRYIYCELLETTYY